MTTDPTGATLEVGTTEVTIVSLEMRAAPASLAPPAPPRGDLVVMRAEPPTVSFYRYLYDTVGAPWLWYERRLMGDDELAELVQNPQVEVHVLYAGGVPAGYAELDRRAATEVELAYFGLLSEFIGQGLGTWFLRWAVAEAWRGAPRRVWVHTCTLDHPRALAVYRQVGFVEYKRETVRIPDPRQLMHE